jgi:leucyl-tRNA synthetase
VAEYDPQKIEAKWQRIWDEQGAFHADTPAPGDAAARPKFYMLEMLPYPSGTLHMGHMRNYTIGDAVARYKRLRGYNVLHPIGWDAFGLPAENAAIERGVHPRDWTNNNVTEFKRVCNRFGFSYDWRREISTCEPEYYRWNQWFFLRMLERGLAFRKRSRVNWCPKCETVLANEQVVDGCCWRHQTTFVEAKELEQWFLKTTAYSDELLEDMKLIESGWPERVLTMQRNWIGKSRGARVKFGLEGGQGIEVFTTRIDTIYGATAVILAPEHPLIAPLLAGAKDTGAKEAELAKLRQQKIREADLATAEKIGMSLGVNAINPFSGAQIPIWVGNFVLMEYGTGAVMCVPGHDERDFEFCRKYNLPIRVVIQPAEGKPLREEDIGEAYTEYGRLVNSGPYTGLTSEEALARMTADAQARGFGEAQITYRLKDWGISRQRYWGTPIPVVYCAKCGMVPVPDDELPVRLPAKVQISGQGKSPLANAPEFVNTTCPKCGMPAQRETDTMDTFVDSSWYFFRYADPQNDQAAFDPAIIGHWLPVDQYVGGIVHAILHLMYTRFFCKVMRDIGLVEFSEPIARLFCQGTVLKGGTAMSKSTGNVVGAISMADKYGADAARVYSLFAAPPEKDMEWSEQGIEGCSRFLHRTYRLFERHAARLRDVAAANPRAVGAEVSAGERAVLRKAHQSLRRITQDYDARWHFNTSVAALMELLNELQGQEPQEENLRPAVLKEALELFVVMLAPMAPHLCEELWEMLGHRDGLARAAWPMWDDNLAREEMVEVVIQVNGKLRGKITAEPGLPEQELQARVLAEAKIAEALAGRQPRKVIVVANKLVNIVV